MILAEVSAPVSRGRANLQERMEKRKKWYRKNGAAWMADYATQQIVAVDPGRQRRHKYIIYVVCGRCLLYIYIYICIYIIHVEVGEESGKGQGRG